MSNFINIEGEEILINIDEISSVTPDHAQLVITMRSSFKEYIDEQMPRATRFYVDMTYSDFIKRVEAARIKTEV